MSSAKEQTFYHAPGVEEVGENARHGGLSRTEEAEGTALGRVRPFHQPANSCVRDGVRPQSAQLGRRPRQGDGDPAVLVLQQDRRGGPGETERDSSIR